MPKVFFANEKKEIEIKKGRTVLRAMRDAGISLESPCSGAGSCGKCKVIIKDQTNIRVGDSLYRLTDEEKASGIVLACQTSVDGDIEVYTISAGDKSGSLQILDAGLKGHIHTDPVITKTCQDGKTLVIDKTDGRDIILGCEEGDTCKEIYGIAMDIGTTTLVCSLVDCISGKELSIASELNPQCTYALDVVSRIQYTVSDQDGLLTLFTCIRDEFNKLIDRVTQQAGIRRDKIYEVVYSGNTTMMHLATNTDPASLGRYPYTSNLEGNTCMPAKAAGLNISPFGRIYLPPVISGYVGSDITSGITITDLKDIPGNTLFIDIGTNGEMVIASNGTLTATSTAAGPAFEGMNITFGCRAENGAIESFQIDENWDIHIGTIGNEKVKGICGSGLFDIAAELVRTGVIDPTGKLVKAEKAALPDILKKRLTKYNNKAAFMLSEDVCLTAMDIRQVQLAKSAIRAGIECMLEINQIRAEDIDLVYIAGSFGYHLRPQSLIELGLLPECMKDKIKFVGNTSKTGALRFLIDKESRPEIFELCTHIKALDLSDYASFEKLFVKYMRF